MVYVHDETHGDISNKEISTIFFWIFFKYIVSRFLIIGKGLANYFEIKKGGKRKCRDVIGLKSCEL